jgi:hypothetical protein
MNAGASAEADADERAETVREGIETARMAGKPLARVVLGLAPGLHRQAPDG